MVALIQRVSQASVIIEGNIQNKIGKGLLVLLGIGKDDTQQDIDCLSNKIVQLRIFNDGRGKMNFSLKDIDGEILLVSQFTLCANTKKGSRPSYIQAARPKVAITLYEQMIAALAKKMNKDIQTGQFGANMQVHLINDGPVTIHIDTVSLQR